jgi:hypothetical protein
VTGANEKAMQGCEVHREGCTGRIVRLRNMARGGLVRGMAADDKEEDPSASSTAQPAGGGGCASISIRTTQCGGSVEEPPPGTLSQLLAYLKWKQRGMVSPHLMPHAGAHTHAAATCKLKL